MVQYYRIAGLTVTMDASGRTEKQSRPYLIDSVEKPDIVMVEKTKAMQEMYPYLTLDESEYIFTCTQFYHKLLDFDGMLLHASAVVKDGYAFLFSAASGTGKSTHTRLWQKVFGHDQTQILNDDKPALRLEDGRWYAYGTPWSGKTNLNKNMRVPLGGICLLERGETNVIEPAVGVGTICAVLQQTVRPPHEEARAKILELLNDLLGKVPVWKLRCNMDPEAARVSHDAMYQAAKERWSEE